MRHLLIRIACFVIASLAALPAQRVRWELPEHGAAIYDRKHRMEFLSLDPEVRRPRELVYPSNGGVLFADELDPRAQYVARAPDDELDLLAVLGFDLRKARSGGKVQWDGLIRPYGLVTVVGRWKKPSPSGSQTFSGELRSVEQNRLHPGGLPHDRARDYDRGIKAKLILARSYDAETGRVVRFSAIVKAEVRPIGDGEAPFTFDVDERWTLREVMDPDAAAFQERVAAAILRGRERIEKRLRDHLRDIQPPPTPRQDHTVDYQGGELALMLLTLIHCGTDRHGDLLREGFDRLRSRGLHDTYSLGVALMALEAFYADPNERQHLIEGHRERPARREPSEADLATMTEWTERLLANRDTSIDPAYVSRWHYQGGTHFDNSNTQYALLGLWSAQLCGVKVSPTVWWAAAAHFLAERCVGEGEVAVEVLDHAARRREKESGRPATTSGFRTEARGWGYSLGTGNAYGSMTCGGVSSLTICLAALADLKAGGRKIADIRSARREGLAWLAQNHSVRRNPGTVQPGYWIDYYLYGLERAFELGRIARLQGRDWYFEGATILCEVQHEDGDFRGRNITDTCFALLFLKKASLPVYTGGK